MHRKRSRAVVLQVKPWFPDISTTWELDRNLYPGSHPRQTSSPNHFETCYVVLVDA